MTQNLFLFGLLFSVSAFALDSPIVQGLSGAGRSGIPREGLFTNPASIALLSSSSSFLIYTKPKIQDFQAGGRALTFGAYDGENTTLKGGVAYSTVARARTLNGVQVYEDRSEIRFAGGRMLSEAIAGGFSARYITKRTGPNETKFLQGDLGAIFPLFNDVRAGITYENLVERENEEPPTGSGGIAYGLGGGIQILADGSRILKGNLKGKNSWSLAAEVTMATDFVFRAGRFQDGYRKKKGWSLGLSWTGPRVSFDYALRKTSETHSEKDHILGVSMAL